MLPLGTTSKVKDIPEPCKLVAAPLTTWMSPTVKPFTASLKVTENGIGLVDVGSGSSVATVAVGRVRSETRTIGVAAVFGLLLPSCATPALIVTVTSPSAVGWTSNV